jgi:hypothetical protein
MKPYVYMRFRCLNCSYLLLHLALTCSHFYHFSLTKKKRKFYFIPLPFFLMLSSRRWTFFFFFLMLSINRRKKKSANSSIKSSSCVHSWMTWLLLFVHVRKKKEMNFLKRSNEVYMCFIKTNKDKIVIEDRKTIVHICAYLKLK